MELGQKCLEEIVQFDDQPAGNEELYFQVFTVLCRLSQLAHSWLHKNLAVFTSGYVTFSALILSSIDGYEAVSFD